MTELFIIRGVPGTGKSTLARSLADDYRRNCVHLEADMWMNRTGKYLYDVRQLDNAHNWCKATTKIMLANGKSVAVSNTFTRLFEFKPYIDMARDLRVSFRVIRCQKEFGSIHNVPESQMEKMRNRFENYEGETYAPYNS